MPPVAPTTRAYTLKLKGGDPLLLWRNHCLFNKGVRLWGEWLLNLRGGLPAKLADDNTLLAFTNDAIAKTHRAELAEITPAAVRLDARFAAASDGDVRADVARRKGELTQEAVKERLRNHRRAEVRRILAISWLWPENPASAVLAECVAATSAAADREMQMAIKKSEPAGFPTGSLLQKQKVLLDRTCLRSRQKADLHFKLCS